MEHKRPHKVHEKQIEAAALRLNGNPVEIDGGEGRNVCSEETNARARAHAASPATQQPRRLAGHVGHVTLCREWAEVLPPVWGLAAVAEPHPRSCRLL